MSRPALSDDFVIPPGYPTPTLVEPSTLLPENRLEQPVADEVDAPDVQFALLGDFLRADFPPAESLLGTARGGTNLLPRFGWVMPWGTAGSAKTSILVDLIFHACAGQNWLHYPAARPLKVIAIVNEGIPGALQDKLAEKLECWNGSGEELKERIAVYQSPWGEFTFRNTRMFDHLQAFARDFEADYVAADPLHTIGTTGAGSPQDTESFKHLLREFGIWDWIGLITPHHSNKAGMLSGDWDRHPDTVIHLVKNGKQPATLMTLEKARPADPDELGVPQLLEWETETKGYKLVPLTRAVAIPDEELYQRIDEYLEHAPDAGATKRDIRDNVTGNATRIGELLTEGLAEGRYEDRTGGSKRPRFGLPDLENGSSPFPRFLGAKEPEEPEGLEWR